MIGWPLFALAKHLTPAAAAISGLGWFTAEPLFCTWIAARPAFRFLPAHTPISLHATSPRLVTLGWQLPSSDSPHSSITPASQTENNREDLHSAPIWYILHSFSFLYKSFSPPFWVVFTSCATYIHSLRADGVHGPAIPAAAAHRRPKVPLPG